MANIWIPILGGILFSAGIMGALVLLASWNTPIYDFGEDGEDEGGSEPPEDYDGPPPFLPEFDLSELWESDRVLFELLIYLYKLDPDELKKFALALKESWLKLEGGGDIAVVGREINLIPLDLAQLSNDPEEIIRHIVNAFTGFRAIVQLNIFLVFFLNLTVDLMGGSVPGPLDLIKYVAQMRNLTNLVKRIEQIQSIKSKIDRALEIKKLRQDLRNAGGQFSEISSSLSPDATTGKPAVGKLIGELMATPGTVVRRFTPPIYGLLIMSVLGLLSIVVFALWGGFGRTSAADVPIEEAEESGLVTEGQPEIELEAPTATPAPTPTLSPLDFVLMFGNFTEEQKSQIALAFLLDPEGDWIYSMSSVIVLQQLAQTDITAYLAIWLRLNSQAAGSWFNQSYYPCNQDIAGGRVVCSPSAGNMAEGRVLMLVMQLAEQVALDDPDHFYTYAAVLDVNGDPGNNFQYFPPYDWDYWQNTDRWYYLDWNPDLGSWSLTMADAGNQFIPAPSNARAVIYQDVIVFFIPADELPEENPAYRLSAFGHDGSYQPDVSCGDVTGVDPTEPLRQPNPEEVAIEE